MSEPKDVLTKAEIVESLASKLPNMTKTLAGDAVNLILAEIVFAVQTGKKVRLKGFATFEAVPTAAKPAKTGRNPRTGEPVAIEAKPAGKRVSIKAKFPAE